MNKKIVILGAGESGIGAAILAKRQGYTVMLSEKGSIPDAVASLLDDYAIAYEDNGHSANLLDGVELIVKSPGIPDTVPIIQESVQRMIPIISEIEFAARYTKAKLIGISGSNGKTTTSLLLYHILKDAGLDVCLAGNVGVSFAKALAESDHDYFVLELSSFQLDGMFNAKLDISILLNITPDHLDRYGFDFSRYAQSKFRLTQNQNAGDYFIYSEDDASIREYFDSISGSPNLIPISIHKDLKKGASLKGQKIKLKLNQKTFEMTIDELALVGKHNTYNSMAAAVAANLLDVRNETLRNSLSDFRNQAHRLEEVGVSEDVKYVNDSKATNVNAVWYALESIPGRIIWIAGGVDKGNDYSDLLPLVQKKVKTLICLGENVQTLKQNFENFVVEFLVARNMEEAVLLSKKYAEAEDTVLLSPACASFDLFKNYEDRGDQFKEMVKSIL